MKEITDILIVGVIIVGNATALELQKTNLDLTISTRGKRKIFFLSSIKS